MISALRNLLPALWEVRLKRCHALTAGGYLIDYDAGDDDELTASFHISTDETEEKGPALGCHTDGRPFRASAIGRSGRERDKPPASPMPCPKYALSVLPTGQTDGSELGRHFLLIGRLRKNGNRCEVDGNFIPPCTSMSSHPDLKGYYTKFGQLVDSIEKASFDILAKVENAEKQTDLATNIGMLCRHVMLFISDIYFSFRNEGQYYSPLRFLNVFSTLAHHLYVCLSFMDKEEKEDLLKYFNEWNGIPQALTKVC